MFKEIDNTKRVNDNSGNGKLSLCNRLTNYVRDLLIRRKKGYLDTQTSHVKILLFKGKGNPEVCESELKGLRVKNNVLQICCNSTETKIDSKEFQNDDCWIDITSKNVLFSDTVMNIAGGISLS